MVSAILLTRAVIDGMAERKFGRIVNITSAMVKQPCPALALSVAAKMAATHGRSLEEERAAQNATSPAGRLGRVEEFGAVCAFYCSAHAGYITGQNLMLDGGRYPAVF